MKLFENIKNLQKEAPTVRVHEVEINNNKYDIATLENKARLGEALTNDEHIALDRHKKEELSNRVLRIVGLVSILVLITLAVGCFLYPYSLLNLFGSGNRFWDCWQHVQYSLDGNVVEKYFHQVVDSYDWADPVILEKFGSREIFQQMFEMSHGVDLTSTGEWRTGWLSLSEIMTIAFQPNTGAKCSFIVIGSWSIVVLSTIGLIAIITYAIYAVAYNIKDLIELVKHLIRGTRYVIEDVGVTVKDNVDTALSDIAKDKAQPTAPKKKRAAKAKPEVKDDVFDDDAAIAKKMAQYKKELEAENTPQPNTTEPVNSTEPLSDLSDDDLNKLLQ